MKGKASLPIHSFAFRRRAAGLPGRSLPGVRRQSLGLRSARSSNRLNVSTLALPTTRRAAVTAMLSPK